MISAALDNDVRNLQAGLQRERLKRKMLQDKLNDVIESLNVVTAYLDGQSVTKMTQLDQRKLIVKIDFIGKKLDFLERDFLDEEGEA